MDAPGTTGRIYAAIDLKSFYASVECVERGLDPMNTNLVVADPSRTEKTICLAVSPTLKAYGIPGRARLFKVVQRVAQVNACRRRDAPGRALCGSSCFDDELKADPALAVDYIVAPPRMAHYITRSTQVYQVYLKYVAPEDIHVYSIDEVFIDLTGYLQTYGLSPRELVKRMILDVLQTTGITAAAGLGANLYLCKVAMDIGAKHVAPDADGVRIAELDERTYRRTLWTHRPLTDFWRIGPGIAKKLEDNLMFTMGDVARCSLGGKDDVHNEEMLYRLFGVNAELLIDHAWGWEPCTIADIKAYRPQSSSIGSGQVLGCATPAATARLILREMAESLALTLVDRDLVTGQLVLSIGYDRENLTDPQRRRGYHGAVDADRYGRAVPRHAHGSARLPRATSSTRQIVDAAAALFDRIADPALLVRRLNLTAANVMTREAADRADSAEQLDLFTDYAVAEQRRAAELAAEEKEKKVQHAMLDIKKKFGKNAIVKGMDLQEGATARERNNTIGGHRAE
ncbi:MAG TPA: DNA methylase [Candidatus Gemmiger faecigallinarum]|nr:DNA methylase [Candidatus Gemmiger faecigallinarum]